MESDSRPAAPRRTAPGSIACPIGAIATLLIGGMLNGLNAASITTPDGACRSRRASPRRWDESSRSEISGVGGGVPSHDVETRATVAGSSAFSTSVGHGIAFNGVLVRVKTSRRNRLSDDRSLGLCTRRALATSNRHGPLPRLALGFQRRRSLTHGRQATPRCARRGFARRTAVVDGRSVPSAALQYRVIVEPDDGASWSTRRPDSRPPAGCSCDIEYLRAARSRAARFASRSCARRRIPRRSGRARPGDDRIPMLPACLVPFRCSAIAPRPSAVPGSPKTSTTRECVRGRLGSRGAVLIGRSETSDDQHGMVGQPHDGPAEDKLAGCEPVVGLIRDDVKHVDHGRPFASPFVQPMSSQRHH